MVTLGQACRRCHGSAAAQAEQIAFESEQHNKQFVHVQNQLLDHFERFSLSRRDLAPDTWNELLGAHCKWSSQDADLCRGHLASVSAQTCLQAGVLWQAPIAS